MITKMVNKFSDVWNFFIDIKRDCMSYIEPDIDIKSSDIAPKKDFIQKSHRPVWEKIWMDFAHSIAERSYDPRHKVGAVVVADDNTQVLAVGYNGNWRGGPNEVESKTPGESGMLHAEINALLKMDYNSHKKKIMYVTLSPCKMCAKAIVNAGIDKVIYDEEYRLKDGLQILKQAGIQVQKFTL